MIRGGTMLIDGSYILIEAGTGNPCQLSDMFRGKTNQQQWIIFKPGMMAFKSEGNPVLTIDDLVVLRHTEKTIRWEKIKAITTPVTIEFSRLQDNQPYIHDMRIVA
ncbi:MAG: hypothetical protein QXP53_02970 [Candidatus Pacearchaeota archaeon]